jgi:hypothetical protein
LQHSLCSSRPFLPTCTGSLFTNLSLASSRTMPPTRRLTRSLLEDYSGSPGAIKEDGSLTDNAAALSRDQIGIIQRSLGRDKLTLVHHLQHGGFQ